MTLLEVGGMQSIQFGCYGAFCLIYCVLQYVLKVNTLWLQNRKVISVMSTVLLEYHQGKLIYEINISYVNKTCIYSDYKWMIDRVSFLHILNWLIHTLVYEYKENIWMWW